MVRTPGRGLPLRREEPPRLSSTLVKIQGWETSMLCFPFLCGLIISLFLFSLYIPVKQSCFRKRQLSFTIRNGLLESRGALAPSLLLILELMKAWRPHTEGVFKKGLMTHITEISRESRGGLSSSSEMV